MLWDDGEAWPAGADGAGYSMVHLPGESLSSSAGWRRSLDINGEAYGPAPLSFAAWQAVYFPAGGPEAEPLADPDKDGMSNAAEYAAAMNPLSPFESGQPVATSVIANGVPCIKIEVRRRPGTSWVIESSTDLASWVTVAAATTVHTGADGREVVTWCLPQKVGRSSYRARADIP
jgi:hypothetical protein